MHYFPNLHWTPRVQAIVGTALVAGSAFGIYKTLKATIKQTKKAKLTYDKWKYKKGLTRELHPNEEEGFA